MSMTLVLLLVLFFYVSMAAVIIEVPDNRKNCIVSKTGQIGKCTEAEKCSEIKISKENENLEKCESSSYVCCPIGRLSKIQKPGKLSKAKCRSYHHVRTQPQFVVFGKKALGKEFPHMAVVGYGESDIFWLCGGTIISHNFVLSAAHCTHSSEHGPARWIRLGDLDLKKTTDDAKPLNRKIIQTYNHPQYKSCSYYHDVALFKLEKRVFFGPYFKPACLQTTEKVPPKLLQAAGWGKTHLFQESSSHLLKVNLNVVDFKKCNVKFADIYNTTKLKNGILEKYQICAGDHTGGDTCLGDSGGPLHYQKRGRKNILGHFVVAGIVSFGKGCGGVDSVGVYTRVSAYVEWIESIVWKDYD